MVLSPKVAQTKFSTALRRPSVSLPVAEECPVSGHSLKAGMVVFLSHRARIILYAWHMDRCLATGLLWGITIAATSLCHADQVDDYLRNEMASHRIPGAALRIIQNGKAVKTATYGLAN